MKTSPYLPAICSVFLASALSASGALLVYEGFNYGTAAASRTGADLLHGQPDGSGGDVDATGLSGTWQDTSGPGATSDLFLQSGSLSFGDLSTSGNSVRSDTNGNNDNFGRTITTSLSGTGEIWFSFLANKLQNNFNAAEGGLVIGNQQVNNSRVFEDDGTSGLAGFGIAPTTSGNNWTAYGWNGSSQVDVGATFGVPTNGSETNFLIGHVSYNTGTAGADEFSFYHYNSGISNITANLANMTQIGTTIDVDVDESTLDTLSLTRQVNTHYDEIRIGTSLDDLVSAIPEPSTALLSGLGALLILRRRRN